MAFKIKNATVDLDLDLSLIMKDNQEVQNVTGGTMMLKPTMEPIGDNIVRWQKVFQENSGDETKEELQKDPEKAMKIIISQIDYWYGKGIDFWYKNFPFVYLKTILEHLQSEVLGLKKK